MPNNKILGITLGLVAIAAITLLMDKKGSTQKDERTGSSLITLEDATSVDKVTLTKDAKNLVLSKNKEGAWHIEGTENFPASAEKIVKFTDDLRKSKYLRAVSSKKEKWQLFELDKGTKLVLGQGQDKSLTFIVGKNRSGGGQYLRTPDSDTSFLVDPQIPINIEASFWELQKLVDTKKEDLKEISYTNQGKNLVTLTKEKKEDNFTVKNLGEKEEFNNTEIAGISSLLQSLTYVERLPLAGNESIGKALEKAPQTVVTKFNGDVYTASIAEISEKIAGDKEAKEEPKEKKKYYLSLTLKNGEGASLAKSKLLNELSQKWYFEIEEYKAKRFLKKRADFIKPKQAS